MNMRGFFLTIAAAAAAAAAAGCATHPETPANETEKRYFDAWMQVNHPDWTKSEHWIYIDEDNEITGDGEEISDGYLFVEYAVRDLSGNITSSTREEDAMKLNTYKEQNYYGPEVWMTSSMTAGVYYAMFDLGGMRTGGRRQAIIPGWMSSSARYDTEEEYLKNVTGNSNAIYDIEFVGQTEDISAWQSDRMAEFVEDNQLGLFTQLSPSDTAETGFYYEGEIYADGALAGYDTERLDTDTASTLFATDTTVDINYIGRRLDGQAFDTTIERVAKDNNIYTSGKEYAPVKITWGENYSSIKMGDDGNSVITGFAKTLWRMSCREGVTRAAGMFWSDFGYNYSGSGDMIPGYAPLIFEIEFTENPEE